MEGIFASFSVHYNIIYSYIRGLKTTRCSVDRAPPRGTFAKDYNIYNVYCIYVCHSHIIYIIYSVYWNRRRLIDHTATTMMTTIILVFYVLCKSVEFKYYCTARIIPHPSEYIGRRITIIIYYIFQYLYC